MKRSLAALALTLTALISLSACSAGSTTASTATADSNFTIAWTSEPTSLDPLTTTATTTRDIANNIFEGLVADDATYTVQPMLADSWTLSSDRKTYTFTLRSGVTFHNGAEMTPKDVAASLNRWLKLSATALAGLPSASARVGSGNTVTLTLSTPNYTTLNLLASGTQPMFVMPASVIDSATSTGVTSYIGTGPFALEKWTKGQSIELKKWTGYKPRSEEASGMAGAKVAQVGHLTFDFVTDTATRLSGLQSGQYNAADSVADASVAQIKSDPSLQLESLQNTFMQIVFNKKEGLMASLPMRQAVSDVVDPDAVLGSVWTTAGSYKVEGSLVSPSNETWYTTAGLDSYGKVDLSAAKAALSSAGYKGEKVRILTSRDIDAVYNTSVVLQQELQSAGIDATLVVKDWATLTQLRADPSAYEIFVTAGSYEAVPTSYAFLTSTWPGWAKDPAMTAALKAIVAATSADEAKTAMDQLQTAYYAYIPQIKVGDGPTYEALSSKVSGFKFLFGPIFWGVSM